MDVDGLLAKGCASRARVGIGLAGGPRIFMMALHLEDMGCRVELVPFEDEASLVDSLSEGEVDAAVRGALSSSMVLGRLKRAFSLKEVMRSALLEDSKGKKFLLTPVGIDEGCDAKSRIELAKQTNHYFSAAGWKLRCGVLSKGRSDDASRGEDIRKSLKEGNRIVRELDKAGIEAKHYGILIEDAVGNCDLVLAPDGVTGNLIFRAMYFIGSGKALGAPVVNMDRVFVDTSRAKTDFSDSILLAAGLAEVRKGWKKRA